MIQVADYIQELKPYKPGKSSDPADFKRYKAILSSNENNYGPSPKAMNAVVDSVQDIHLYPDPQGAQLVKALEKKHHRSSAEFILSNGLDGLLYSMFKAFAAPGDEVLTNNRSFVAFEKFAAMYDVKVNRIPNSGYQFDLTSIPKYITENTKIVYICNPNNPTGLAVSKDTLHNAIASVPKDVLVVVDEAYFDYAKHLDKNFPDSSEMGYENVLTLRTFSKLYGLAGLRIGYGIGHSTIIEALKKVKLVFNPNLLAQVAALAALEDKAHVQKTLENNTYWISQVQNKLSSMGIKVTDSRANFVCAVFSDSEEANQFTAYLDRNNILVRPLMGFGMPEGVRISIGTNEEMEYFMEIVDRF